MLAPRARVRGGNLEPYGRVPLPRRCPAPAGHAVPGRYAPTMTAPARTGPGPSSPHRNPLTGIYQEDGEYQVLGRPPDHLALPGSI